MTDTDTPAAASGGGEAAGEPFRILFVCTGNTCRSPLAAAIARRAIEERGWTHVEVQSAGVAAGEGGRASEGSIRAAERHGLDLSDHRTAPLRKDLADWADLVLTMSPDHLIGAAIHGAGGKASVITDFAEGRLPADNPESPGVLDPVGGDDATYEGTFAELDALMDRVMTRLAPVVDP